MTNDENQKRDEEVSDEESSNRRDLEKGEMGPPGIRKYQEAHQRLMDPFGIRKYQEAHQRLMDPFGIRKYQEAHQRLMDPFGIRKHQETHRRLMDPFGIRKLPKTQDQLLTLLDPTGLRRIQERQSTLRALIGTTDLQGSTGVLAQSLGIVAEGTRLIESALERANLPESAHHAGMASSGLSQFAHQPRESLAETAEFLRAAVTYFASPVESSPADLVCEVPSELFLAVDADQSLHSGSDEIAREERSTIAGSASDELEAILRSGHPELVNILNGARQAAASDNPDRLRHVSISLRELLGIALRKVAPDEAIKLWTNSNDHFHEGKPTRRARLEYLFRSITEPSLRSLIEADLRAAKELFDALSSAAHLPTVSTSRESLVMLISRAEGTLLLMLRLAVRVE